MSLEITGILEEILPIETGEKKDGSGTWSKQNFLVRTAEEYNNLYCFEVFGDEKITNLTKYQKEGDGVKITFNVNTNEWNGKYFTSLSAWRIEAIKATSAPEPMKAEPQTEVDDEEMDLPF